MKKLCIVANCQTESLALWLRHAVTDVQVWATDFLDGNVHSQESRSEAEQEFKNADFIFIQNGGKDIYNAADVKRAYPGKTCVIANLYFRGLHPDTCYVGAIEDRLQNPTLYHSVAVLDAYLSGQSTKKAIDSFSVTNFQRLGLLDAWETSLEQLVLRDHKIDVAAADLINQRCHEYAAFYTPNHPRLSLVQDYLIEVLKYVGLACASINLDAHRDPLRTHDIVPLHDFVAEYYGLPFRTTQHWMISHMGGRFVTRQNYVEAFYRDYDKVDKKKLKVHSPVDLVASLTQRRIDHLIAPSDI